MPRRLPKPVKGRPSDPGKMLSLRAKLGGKAVKLTDVQAHLAWLTDQQEILAEMIHSTQTLRRGTVIGPGISGGTYYVAETGENQQSGNGMEYQQVRSNPIPGTPRVSGAKLVYGDDFQGTVLLNISTFYPPDQHPIQPDFSVTFSRPRKTPPACVLVEAYDLPNAPSGAHADVLALPGGIGQGGFNVALVSLTGASLTHGSGLTQSLSLYVDYYAPSEDFWPNADVLIGENQGLPFIFGAMHQ